MKSADFLGPYGPLVAALPGYQPRSQQIQMATAVEQALSANQILLVEAPTGVGKSFAFLLPLIQHAKVTGKPVVVSTAGIALQEQLAMKDLPFLQKVLPIPFTFSVVKGKSNYVCRERLENENLPHWAQTKGPEFVSQAQAILQWAKDTDEGDKAELPFEPLPALWMRVCGSQQACFSKHCKDSGCCVAQSRTRAGIADVVLTNHHTLLFHLRRPSRTMPALPEFSALVIDEAHELPDIVRGVFGASIPIFDFLHLGKQAQEDRLKPESIHSQAESFFGKCADVLRRDSRRLRGPLPIDVEPLCRALDGATYAWTTDFERKHNEELSDSLQGWLRDFAAPRDSWVYWIDGNHESGYKVKLEAHPADVGGFLKDCLYKLTTPLVMTSATLTVARKFDFFKRQAGVPDTAATLAVDSPFDFNKSALIVMPPMPDPASPEFPNAVAKRVNEAVKQAKGRTLALFTSWSVLQVAARALAGCKYKVYVQGAMPRGQLLTEFAKDESSVLLGTTSFWTGVDVPGPSLSCLVIDRIPFPCPDDPMADAFKDAHPKEWFLWYSLPRASIQLHQGFGRLIRRTTDRGCVVLLDNRLSTKSYGTVLLNTLPTRNFADAMDDIGDFLRETE